MTDIALQDRYFPDNACFGCGPNNPEGLHLKSYVGEDGIVVAEWTPDARFQGPPGIVNGGVMAVPMDCHSTWTAMNAYTDAAGSPRGAVTASYEVRLRRPTPVAVRVSFRAEVRVHEGRRIEVACDATVDDEVTAIFIGSFREIDLWSGDGH